MQQKGCPFYVCQLIIWCVTYSKWQMCRICLLLPTRKQQRRHHLHKSSTVVREREEVRHLQRPWSWVCLFHSQRRGEKPRTSDVHQSYWEHEISLGPHWNTVTQETQGNRVFLVKRMTQTQSMRVFRKGHGKQTLYSRLTFI